VKKKRHPNASGSGYAARAQKALYDETQHPRDAHGHWIVTNGGYRRIRAGSTAKRNTLARSIRKARSGLKTNSEHTSLTLRLRTMRAKRHGLPAPAGSRRPRPTIDQVRRQVADRAEKTMADRLGGKRLKDYEAFDVHVAKAGGAGKHVVEVKTMQHGSRPTLSVHPNAFVRKIDHARKNKDDTFHTVLMDLRATSEGGVHAAQYSGHDIYYKRTSGPFSVSKMYKVKDMDELKRLIEAPGNKLPKAARAVFPSGPKLAELRVKAAKDRAYNNERSKENKVKKGRAAYGR
jgi:hypothetical protein